MGLVSSPSSFSPSKTPLENSNLGAHVVHGPSDALPQSQLPPIEISPKESPRGKIFLPPVSLKTEIATECHEPGAIRAHRRCVAQVALARHFDPISLTGYLMPGSNGPRSPMLPLPIGLAGRQEIAGNAGHYGDSGELGEIGMDYS